MGAGFTPANEIMSLDPGKRPRGQIGGRAIQPEPQPPQTAQGDVAAFGFDHANGQIGVAQHGPDGVARLDLVRRREQHESGDLVGVTTTSGLFFKIPGRVGDSPVVGAGLYSENGVGSAGSTGRGEATLLTCGSHTVVEHLRDGLALTGRLATV